MKKVLLGVMTCAGFSTAFSTVYADEWSLSARTQYFFDDFSTGGLKEGEQFDQDGEVIPDALDFLISSEPFQFAMFGGSISYRSDSVLSSTRFTLNGLYGEANVDNRVLLGATPVFRDETGAPIPQDRIISLRRQTQAEAERIDVELSTETRLNDFLSVVGGVRYEKSDIEITGQDFQISWVQGVNPATLRTGVESDITDDLSDGYELFTARLGVAGNIPLDTARKHNFYVNAQGFIGARDAQKGGDGVPLDDATVAGPDVSVGYNYRISDDWVLDARYRSSFFFFLSGRRNFGETKSTHGPSLALVKRF